MAKSINKKSLFLNLHSIINIKTSYLIDELSSYLVNRLGMFIIEGDSKEQKADIVLSQSDIIKKYDLQPYNPKDTNRFWLKKREDKIFIVFTYREKADIVVCLSDPIELFYKPRAGCSGSLWDCLFLCIQIALYRKSGLIVKGATLSLGDIAVTLSGLSGSGKTILLLKMLNEGWDFLSNDHFILFNKKAYIFRRDICISYHHYQIYPWLAKQNLINKKLKRWGWLYKRFQKVTENHIPSYILHSTRLKKLYNPIFCQDLKDFFPNCKIIHSTEPKIWIALASGSEFEFTKVTKTEIIQDICSIQILTFDLFERIGQLLSLYGYGSYFETNKLVEANLKEDQKFYRVRVPYNSDVNWLYSNFIQCLKQAL